MAFFAEQCDINICFRLNAMTGHFFLCEFINNICSERQKNNQVLLTLRCKIFETLNYI